MSRLMRDGTTEPVSRDQIIRREQGQGKACSQRLRKVCHHWLLRNSHTTVNKVRGIEKEIFANYWRQKYPNGTLSWWKRANKNYNLHNTRFHEKSVVLQYHSLSRIA